MANDASRTTAGDSDLGYFDINPSCPGGFRFRQIERQNTVFKFGCDLTLINFLAEAFS